MDKFLKSSLESHPLLSYATNILAAIDLPNLRGLLTHTYLLSLSNTRSAEQSVGIKVGGF